MRGEHGAIFKRAAKGFVILMAIILACRFTKGFAIVPLLVFALGAAFSGKMGVSLSALVLCPALVMINPFLLPKPLILGVCLRFGPLLMGLALLVTASRRQGIHKLPLAYLWAYLFVACLSSAMGYAPKISYLKIVNFALFLVGIIFGFRNIDRSPRDLEILRTFLLSFCCLIIYGSILMRIFVPGACYLTSMSVMLEEGSAAAADVVSNSSGLSLFAGITRQSQALAPLVSSCIALVLCDMFFVERRVSKFHVLTVLCALPLVYWTSSRTALLTSSVGVAILYFYCLKRIRVASRFRLRIRTAMMWGGVILFCVCAVMEVRNHSISRWIRKNDDVASDTRSWTAAVTESRQGKLEENMEDFRRNPLLGSGFQVTADMSRTYRRAGFILSAPIEKGVLPAMVLGETGILGAIVFAVFLISFYGTCARRHYYATLTMMSVLLASNMGEASFFSPGGIGGIMWVACVGGGFAIDMMAIARARREASLGFRV